MPTATVQLEEKLRSGESVFTLTEASAITGISIDHTKDALDELISKYICRLQVTENGDLIYDFGASPRRRDRISFKEIMNIAGKFAWNILTFLFRVWIAFMLVFYFIASILIVMGLVIWAVTSKFGGSGRSGGRKSSSDGGMAGGMIGGLFGFLFEFFVELFAQLFGAIFRFFVSLMRRKTSADEIREETDAGGYKYKKFKPAPGLIRPEKKNFVASVYDFVFGPDRVETDPLNNEKEVAAYLKEQKGILVVSELMGLAGWTLKQAGEFFTDCLIRFQGAVEVTEKGAMFGKFRDLIRGVGKAETGEIIWYWDEYEPEYEVTGNTRGVNIFLLFMNGLNFLVSFEMMRFFGYMRDILGTAVSGVTYKILFVFPVNVTSEFITGFEVEGAFFFYFWFGCLPLVFSTLFFLFPLLRAIRYRKASEERVGRNIRKRIFKAIFAVKGEPRSVDQYVSLVNDGAPEDAIALSELEHQLKELMLDLGGDTVVSEETGALLYRFDTIALEMEEVIRLRAGQRREAGLGEIIADTE